jgi:transposase
MNDNLIHQIVILFQGGASIRRIARSLHIGRRTVQRVLEQHQQARTVDPPWDVPGSAPQRGSQLDAFNAAIRDLLARYPDITVQRVHEELRRLGYQGGYTILSQRVRTLRPRLLIVPVQRFETAMGQQAQMDYSTYDLDFTVEGRRRVYAFSYVLGYSRRQYLHFVESQDFATTVREHIRAFEHLGGVAATCLYDNMKVVVSGYDGDEPVYNPRFLGFAAHYGFRPVACRRRRPQTKGKVERKFGYVESSLLNGRAFVPWSISTRRRPGGWPRSPTCTSIVRPRRARWIATPRNNRFSYRCRLGLSTLPRSCTEPSMPKGMWSTVRTSIRRPGG